MFGLRRSANRETSRRARLGWVDVHRSLPLPTAGIPTSAELVAEAEQHAERLLAAGAVDQHNAHSIDVLFDELFHDARVALRSAADEQAAVDDRLVDQARAAWVAARQRHALAFTEVERREEMLELHHRRLAGLPAPEVAAPTLTPVHDAD